VPLYIWKGIIPAGLGNILGGALFCGGYYWYMYSFNQDSPLIDGVAYEPHDDVEKGFAAGHVEKIDDYSNGSPLASVNTIQQEVRRVRETGA